MFLYNAETFVLKSNTWYHLKWIYSNIKEIKKVNNEQTNRQIDQ